MPLLHFRGRNGLQRDAAIRQSRGSPWRGRAPAVPNRGHGRPRGRLCSGQSRGESGQLLPPAVPGPEAGVKTRVLQRAGSGSGPDWRRMPWSACRPGDKTDCGAGESVRWCLHVPVRQGGLPIARGLPPQTGFSCHEGDRCAVYRRRIPPRCAFRDWKPHALHGVWTGLESWWRQGQGACLFSLKMGEEGAWVRSSREESQGGTDVPPPGGANSRSVRRGDRASMCWRCLRRA